MSRAVTLTVTEVNEYIKMLIDTNELLSDICVKGEISNFTNHRTGHYYFSLKDAGGLIRAVMFRGQAQKLKFIPEDGMKVIIRGRISAFVRDGQYQIYAEDIQPDGVGSLYIAFEQLKRRLEAEGLFDPARKKRLPKLPRRVGIVTSPTGAAIRDMINIFGRRFPYTELVLYPALVQGPGAAAQIAEGVRYFNRERSVDVIIVGRGGGSMEDLWAFNDEALARCVASSDIPVISAVGHETDFTICDFAADLRAPTPSAAAELAVPETEDIKRRLENINIRNRNTICGRIEIYKGRLDRLSRAGVLSSPERLLDGRRMNVLYCSEKLQRRASDISNGEKIKLARTVSKLEALNPLGIISRGYSAVTDGEGEVIKSARQLSKGQSIRVRFADGEARATVEETDIKNKVEE